MNILRYLRKLICKALVAVGEVNDAAVLETGFLDAMLHDAPCRLQHWQDGGNVGLDGRANVSLKSIQAAISTVSTLWPTGQGNLCHGLCNLCRREAQ